MSMEATLIAPDQLAALQATEPVVVIDTRDADTFAAGHVPGAMNSGYGQSCRGYYLLTWLGYPRIKVLNGGFSAWKAAGLPVSTTVATPVPASFPELPMAA